MGNIAVVHPNLGIRGGAEDVCMHTLEALQTDHSLTLVTLERPNIRSLNEYFRTDVRQLNIQLAGHLGGKLREVAGHRLLRLQAALLGRYARQHEDEFDLLVSTKNEFGLTPPTVQYIHSPQFASADPGIDRVSLPRQVYDRVCSELASIDTPTLQSATLLANSEWTAGAVAEAYGVTAHTLYPPVDTTKFPSCPWDDREPGFLTVGRIGPSKRILQNINIVAALRDRGHDVHLHIVGPTTDGDYCEKVKARAAKLEFVSVEGAVSSERLTELIATHRYGIHGRPYEHFGIVVAEFVAGGAIPFAPNSGGQREILHEDSRLLYESQADAVEKIDRVLSEPSLQADIRHTFENTEFPFSREQFKQRMATVVNEALKR
ncbi:Glycosyltransferase involved in cell wall bisynthesis [Halogranum amylolyticum]|uniref:Glycosyltransferase involved in cell wall bisynthesis n=2 Tax=Halogranum amylolyticum TaxID=660520 RepID=A0A1H8WPI5_9EURY|nr:Glycosyltransferase involved in cell wall bisynthesis [Halogranum amylolyticum]